MQNIFINRSLHLRTGELATVQINGAIKLQIGKGRVWITMEGAPDDYWLSGGEQIEIAGRGMLVVDGADALLTPACGVSGRNSLHWRLCKPLPRLSGAALKTISAPSTPCAPTPTAATAKPPTSSGLSNIPRYLRWAWALTSLTFSMPMALP